MDWGLKVLIKSYMNPDFGKTGFGEKINSSDKENRAVSNTALRTLQRKTDSHGILESKEQDIATSSRKKVDFYPSVAVILIPTKEEFVKAGVAEDMWWSKEDQALFKFDAMKEVSDFFRQNPTKCPQEFKRRMNFPSIEQDSRDANL